MIDQRKGNPITNQNDLLLQPVNAVTLNLGGGASVSISSPEPLEKVVKTAVGIAQRYKRNDEMAEIIG